MAERTFEHEPLAIRCLKIQGMATVKFSGYDPMPTPPWP